MRASTASELAKPLITAILVVAVGSILYPPLAHDWSFLTGGVRGVAVVTRLHVDAGAHGAAYAVDYRLQPTTTSGKSYVGTGATSKSAFDGLEVGRNVPVFYDPQSPDRSTLDIGHGIYLDFSYRAGAWAVAAFAFVLVTSNFLIAFFKQRWLLRWGSVAEAAIVSERRYFGYRSRYTAVGYRFADAVGRFISDERGDFPATLDRANYPEIFRNPVVLFDPRNPKRNVLYGNLFFACLRPPSGAGVGLAAHP